MPNLIEDRLTSLLAEWIDSNRPDEFPDAADLPVDVARRDEIRTRPCVVLNAAESKPIPAMPHSPGQNHGGPRRKKAPPCDEPGFLAAQVFAVAAETGWPEKRILFMPVARLAQYQHCLLRRNGVRTHWSATGEGGTSLRGQLEALRLTPSDFSTLEFHSPKSLTGRYNGWAGIAPDGRIFVYSFTM